MLHTRPALGCPSPSLACTDPGPRVRQRSTCRATSPPLLRSRGPVWTRWCAWRPTTRGCCGPGPTGTRSSPGRRGRGGAETLADAYDERRCSGPGRREPGPGGGNRARQGGGRASDQTQVNRCVCERERQRQRQTDRQTQMG